jgi:hypothetical protein
MRIFMKKFAPVLLTASLIAAGAASPAFASGAEVGDGGAMFEPMGTVEEMEAREARAAETIRAADALLGEELVYHISFWIFQDMAIGKVTLESDEDGGYVATLDAHTVGMVDKIFQHRHDIYTSYLELSPDGTIFITKSFKKTTDVNGKVRNGVTYMDYENRVMTWMSWGGGKEEKSGGSGFPEGVYPVDPLTAFYNFRIGAYGPAGEGREYRIPTFPKDEKVPELYMRITTREEMKKRRRGVKAPAADYLADARIDKEFFGSGSGEIEILFTGGLLPVKAVAKDVAFFGDVTGTLREVGVKMDFKKTGGADESGGDNMSGTGGVASNGGR